MAALCVVCAATAPACLAEDKPPRPDPKTAFCTRLQERSDAAFTRKDLAFLDQEADRLASRDPDLARRLRKIAGAGRLEADLAIYLKKGVSVKRRRKLEKLLEDKFPKLKTYEYITSPAALRAFREKYADNPELFENLGRRDLPPYYLVEAGRESADEIRRKVVRELPYVEKIIMEDDLRAKALRRIGALCDL